MARYAVINTDTDTAVGESYDTALEALDAMYEVAPLVVPWDGVEQPYAVQEVA